MNFVKFFKIIFFIEHLRASAYEILILIIRDTADLSKDAFHKNFQVFIWNYSFSVASLGEMLGEHQGCHIYLKLPQDALIKGSVLAMGRT